MNMSLFLRTKALVSSSSGCEIRVAYAFPYEPADNSLCHSKWYVLSKSSPTVCISLFRSFDCRTNQFRAYVCPTFASQGRRFTPNATITATRSLVLDAPAPTQKVTPAPAWTLRYRVVDGFIQPWANDGHLRSGLAFVGSKVALCSPVSQLTRMKAALRCVSSGGAIAYDPCFSSSDGTTRSVACSTAPGSKSFIRIEST
jgi:hypothetical protein